MEAGKFVQFQPDPDGEANAEDKSCVTDLVQISKSEAPEDEKQTHNSLMMTVLSNGLIWKTLGRCLNVSDLKCCRLVNRKMNKMVMNETKFKDRVVLKVKKKKLTPEEFGKTEENWKKVILNFPVENTADPSNYEWLYPLLSKVEFLSFRLHGKVTTALTTDLHPLLGRLLSSCKELKSLACEPEFIHLGSGNISDGMETLEKLEQLEILKPDAGSRKPLPGSEHMKNSRKVIPDFSWNLRNVKLYKSYFLPFRMDDLSLASALGSRRIWEEAGFLHMFRGTMFGNNCKHLQSYPFYDPSNMSVGDSVSRFDIVCDTPALKGLEADSFNLEIPIGVANFISCLNSRPLLEQLDISCPFYDPEDSSVLSRLIHSIRRHVSLKKLKLLITLGNLSDWIFLRESSLRELRLEDYRTTAEANEWIRQVMTNLPKSVEKLYLRGAVLERGQKKKLESPTEPLKTELLARLDPKLVTQLSIFNAGGLVDNEVADWICRNFRMLRKFNLSEAQTDDEGFNEISGLKGLRFLTLKGCGISDVTLKRIRFLELCYLDVTGSPQATIDGIKMAMKKCPSLETLIIPHRGCSFTKGDGLKICPRLKFLIQSNDGAPPDL